MEVLDEPDGLGRPVRVNLDLQDDFRLNQPLGLFVVEAVPVLDMSAPDYHMQVLSLAESVLDDPMPVLLAQRDQARTELMGRMKAEGVEYTERMERLAEVTWPRPEAEFIDPAFNVFARCHPWVGNLRPSPKAVVRDMLEHADTFNQYVSRYGLKRSEGVLLRYLTDCCKALKQTVPADAADDELICCGGVAGGDGADRWIRACSTNGNGCATPRQWRRGRSHTAQTRRHNRDHSTRCQPDITETTLPGSDRR